MPAKTDRGLVTQAEYARLRKARGLSGGTRESVRKAVDAGRISCFGHQKLVDPKLADKQWQSNTRAWTPSSTPRAGGSEPLQASLDQARAGALPLDPAGAYAPHGGGGGDQAQHAAEPSYLHHRVKREAAEAEMAEMNAAKMRGLLLLRADVDRACFEVGRELRDTLDVCARTIASELASARDAVVCEAVVRREHTLALQALVKAFREKLPQSEAQA